MIGAKKFTWNTCCQTLMSVCDRGQPRAAVRFWRDCGIVDERMQLTFRQPALDFIDRLRRVGRIAEIDLNVVFGPGLPRTVFRKRMARAGNDAPAGGRKTLHRRMADPAACAGQQQRAARAVVGNRHFLTILR